MAAIATPLQIVSGDFNARYLATYQPVKFAAMEGVVRTEQGVPLKIGGLADPETGEIRYAIEIPKGLSLLAYLDPNATIKGLDQVPRQDWPNALLVHSSFDGMVGCGLFGLLVAILFWGLYWFKKRTFPENRLLLWGIVLAGPLAFLAIELGWMVTELGRQPWVIYGYLRTRDAVTTAPWLNVSFLIFSLVYVLLSVALIWLLLQVARRPLPQVKVIGDRYQVTEPATEGVKEVGM
jgi:cytochrome d ubiquinol oxidase subunit I